ncbi:MAG TPA: Ig-like domain-containing protein, partial [Nitrososphaeraceae archaeon]|nr:Ig-like domain-containing protein [Nitrososphaeraceae archaeon]
TEDDFEKEQADKISESESPDVDVQSFINETANKVPKAPTTDNETAVTTTEENAVEEEEDDKVPTAPTTDNGTAVTTEDTVEGKPSELLEMDPETGDEIQDIKGEQQTEQAQQVEETDESQTPQVEETDESQTPQVEESPNTEPIAQDGSVTTSQNQQLNIKLNANDADGDNLLFTIVDDPSNGELGNVKPSTNTVTYTPDEDYSGEDNFTFIVNDGTSDSKEATVSITVEEQQQTTEQAQQEEETDESQTPQEEEEDS